MEREPTSTQKPGAVDARAAHKRAGERFRPGGPWRAIAMRAGNRFADVGGWLGRQIRQEAQFGTGFHFVPVFVGLGVAAYFLAPAEPYLAAPVSVLVILCVALTRLRNRGLVWAAALCIALVMAGMSAGKLRVARVGTPVLGEQITAQITALVLNVDRNSRGSPRYLMAPISIDGIGTPALPRRVRASASAGHEPIAIGGAIAGLVRLAPVNGPAIPGGYDFSFHAWFAGQGASGFFMGAPSPAGIEPQPSPSQQAVIAINTVRERIASHIRDVLPGENGDVAVALITGDRSGIDRETQESLRRSGLAHVLAISGMHMALVTLTVVWCVRALLAWFPAIVLNHPIHKWAAAAGFIAASTYLVISGMGIATQRAWIMISVMLLAVLLNRRAITLRNVSVAAIVILLLRPESLLSPGFQMSFAAVAAIVSGYEAWYRWRAGRSEPVRANRLLRYVAALAFTSLLAGLATALFAAWHFHRVAPLGLLANLGAMPIVSTAVMPLALASVLLMPFGFAALALAPLGIAIDLVLAVSHNVNQLGSAGVIGQLSPAFVVLAAVGLFALTMLRSRLRLAGVLVLAAIPAVAGRVDPPDIALSEGGRAMTVLGSDRRQAPLYPRRNRFVTEIWLRAWSRDVAGEPDPAGPCDRDQCVARTRQGLVVHVVYDPDLLGEACRSADILLAPRLRWVNCRGPAAARPLLIVKRGQLEEFGTHLIHVTARDGEARSLSTTISRSERRSGVELRVTTAYAGANRPWTAHRQGRAAYLQD